MGKSKEDRTVRPGEKATDWFRRLGYLDVMPGMIYAEIAKGHCLDCRAIFMREKDFNRQLIYALGQWLPTFERIMQQNKICWTMLGSLGEGNPHEWYLAAYSPEAEFSLLSSCPFGHWVRFNEWNFSSAIDEYEPKPYLRRPMHFMPQPGASW